MGVGDVDGEKRDALCAQVLGEIDECRQLLEIPALQSDSDAGRDSMGGGGLDAFADFMKGVQAANRGVGPGVRAVQRDGDGLEQRRRAACMLRERQTRREQPYFEAVAAQRLRNRRPLRVEQRFAARQQHDLSVQLRKTGQQAGYRREVHVVPAMTPVVAGDATRIAAVRNIESNQRQLG